MYWARYLTSSQGSESTYTTLKVMLERTDVTKVVDGYWME
jgi:hypothetical protein